MDSVVSCNLYIFKNIPIITFYSRFFSIQLKPQIFNPPASAYETLGSKLYIIKRGPDSLPSCLTSHRFQFATKYLVWFDGTRWVFYLKKIYIYIHPQSKALSVILKSTEAGKF